MRNIEVKRLAFGLASFAFQYHARRHTNRLINAVEVIDNLDTLCPKPEDQFGLNPEDEGITPARVQVGG